MNWMRVKLERVACANERAISVFASPGKSSISTWPSRKNAEQDELERVALADDRPLELVEDAPGGRGDVLDRHRASPVRRQNWQVRASAGRTRAPAELPVGPKQLPQLFAEQCLRPLRLCSRVDAVTCVSRSAARLRTSGRSR